MFHLSSCRCGVLRLHDWMKRSSVGTAELAAMRSQHTGDKRVDMSGTKRGYTGSSTAFRKGEILRHGSGDNRERGGSQIWGRMAIMGVGCVNQMTLMTLLRGRLHARATYIARRSRRDPGREGRSSSEMRRLQTWMRAPGVS